jgi:hypothetical protein
MKILLTFNGGLGDVMNDYFRSREWGVLRKFKERDNPEIKVIAYSHNSNSSEFLKYCPFVDSIETGPALYLNLTKANTLREYLSPLYPEWQFMGEAYYHWRDITPERPKIYLDEEDEAIVKEVKDMGEYIVYHPFVDTLERLCLSPDGYRQLAYRIADELQRPVIVMGATHERSIREADSDIHQYEKLIENFESDREDIISLTNKISCRAAAKISMDACAYVGNYAGLIIAPWVQEIPTVALISESHREMARVSEPLSWPTTRGFAFSREIYPQTQEESKTLDDTIQFLKQRI